MKCDELETEYLYEDRVITPATRRLAYYRASQVDEAIKELKARIAQLEDDNALLRKNNAELREATLWINVNDGFPAVGASVLISDDFVRKVGALMYDYTWNVDEVFYDVDDYKPEVK